MTLESNPPDSFPEGLLLAFYGDDFTGATDAMEAMTAAGVPTVLFLDRPGPQALARFPGARCIGLAGSSRGRSTTWMDAHLPDAFTALARLGAPILHYKVCSTFDSSPTVGSIGRAIDIGVGIMPGQWSPTVVGAPRLKRYQVFGNLFAAVEGVGHRLDRHPTMSRHPVTPMHEADLRRHLQEQTDRPIELIDMVQLREQTARQRQQDLQGPSIPIVLIDVLDEKTLYEAGRLVWEQRGGGLFSASSSGLCYALTAYWREAGHLPKESSLPTAAPTPVIAAVSGSCSPVTAAQIRWAAEHGFFTERLDIARILNLATRVDEIERVVTLAAGAMRAGRSALVFSAQGPDDPAVTTFSSLAKAANLDKTDAARQIGAALAQVMRELLDAVKPQRVVVAGGDSSGDVASALAIEALTVIASISPGAPLCRAWSADTARDGLEIVLKGGQMGEADFFGRARDGSAPTAGLQP